MRGGGAANGVAGPGGAALRSDPSGRNEPGKLSNLLTRVADAHTWIFKSDPGKGRRVWRRCLFLPPQREGLRGIWGKVT